MSDPAGRVSLVTGAGSGIGRAVTLALAAEGSTVWLVGRTVRKLEETALLARGSGARVECVEADVSADADVAALCRRVEQEAAALDVLVHCAAVIALGPVASAGVDDFDRQYRVNLRAPYVLTQRLLPLLKRRRGHVVFINSSAGHAAPPEAGQYAATKFGLRALADSLRAEVNADGVRVLTVYPGRTATAMGRTVHAMEGKPYRPDTLVQPEDVAAVILSALGLPATAEVTEITIRPMRKP
jgi:NADP-dependent 3-hydroxy acid dehydrogenase YdfG